MKNLTNKKRNSKARIVEIGRICLTFTRSNLHVNVTDDRGNTLVWCNCGVMKFKGKKKNSPLAAFILVSSTVKKAVCDYNMFSASIVLRGNSIVAAREGAIRGVAADLNSLDASKIGQYALKKTISKITINFIDDLTGKRPFNGCRRRKPQSG